MEQNSTIRILTTVVINTTCYHTNLGRKHVLGVTVRSIQVQPAQLPPNTLQVWVGQHGWGVPHVAGVEVHRSIGVAEEKLYCSGTVVGSNTSYFYAYRTQCKHCLYLTII